MYVLIRDGGINKVTALEECPQYSCTKNKKKRGVVVGKSVPEHSLSWESGGHQKSYFEQRRQIVGENFFGRYERIKEYYVVQQTITRSL